MVDKITKSFIDGTPYAQKGQVMYCDRSTPGFAVIVGKATKTYIAQKDIRGRMVRCTIGRHGHFTPDEARKIAKEKLYLMAQGVNPKEEERKERAKGITLRQLIESYLNARKNLKPRTRTEYEYYMSKYLPDWLDRPVTELNKETIATRHTYIGENNGKRVANTTMRILRTLINHAYVKFEICEVNPVSYLTLSKSWYPEKRRQTYIRSQDIKAWWDAVQTLENDTYRDYLLTLLFTGLRRTEAAQIRWKDIDFVERTFTVPDTKNGDPLTLPMSQFLHDLFQERLKKYGQYEFVFPGPGEFGYLIEPKKGIRKVIKRSGVQFTAHDLRRTFITIAESLDISPYVLKRLLNHRVTDITGSYIIIDVERLRKPVAQIADHIQELAGGAIQRS